MDAQCAAPPARAEAARVASAAVVAVSGVTEKEEEEDEGEGGAASGSAAPPGREGRMFGARRGVEAPWPSGGAPAGGVSEK